MSHYVGKNAIATCPRCGRRRQYVAKNRGELCVDCRYVEPHWPEIKPPLNTEGIKP